MSGSTSPLAPTYKGIVTNTRQALVLFEACLSGRLNHVPRRPHDRERGELIRSGHIFIYEEHASGIKRWTDGLNWSPSRILGNFLVYRELDGRIPPGEKKRALKGKSPVKHSTTGAGVTKPMHRSSGSGSVPNLTLATGPGSAELAPPLPGTWRPGQPPDILPDGHGAESDSQDPMRQLVGSLTDSYGFKGYDGLVKKTISIKFNGVAHHLVNYYSLDDALNGRLREPWYDPVFKGMIIRQELLEQTNLRVPLGADFTDGQGCSYMSNCVGTDPTAVYHLHNFAQLPAPAGQPRPVSGTVPFDELGQSTRNQLDQMSGQFTSQMPSHLHSQLPAPQPTPLPTQQGGQFPSPPMGGGYQMPSQMSNQMSHQMSSQMPMSLANNYPPTHAPSTYQPQSSFDAGFDGQFVTPPAHHNEAHGNSNGANASFIDNAYNNHFADDEPSYQMDNPFSGYGGQ